MMLANPRVNTDRSQEKLARGRLRAVRYTVGCEEI
jgi:hypothetical protein